MKPFAFFFALALALALLNAGSAAAQAQDAPDLMKTPECAAARQQLEAVLEFGGPRDRLTTVRRQAALLCLGVSLPEDGPGQPVLRPERAAGSTPKNWVQPPALAVDPIRLRTTPMLAQPSPAVGPLTAPTAAPVLPGPAVLTACDATGCWDSAGNRYNSQGQLMLGPRRVCTQQGGLLICP